jgi:hypothetical protein
MWHVIVIDNANDRFAVDALDADTVIRLPIDVPEAPNNVVSTMRRELERLQLVPHALALDFYRIATAIYSSDLQIPRKTSYERWERSVDLYIPVSDPRRWEVVRPQLIELMGFLTGDVWQFYFRPLHQRAIVNENPPPLEDIATVCLLSGGLDSLIGAIDALSAGTPTWLVSHYGRGSSYVNSCRTLSGKTSLFQSRKMRGPEMSKTTYLQSDTIFLR